MSKGTYEDFFHLLAVRESRGVFDASLTPNYQALGDNGYNYLGAFQFDEWAMENMGYYREDGDMNAPINWKAGYFTGKDGINSMQDFLNNPQEQLDAAHQWMNEFVWGWVKDAGLEQYIGTTLGGVEITATGLLAGAHLRGANAVKQLLSSGGSVDPADPYGTPVSVYVKNFSGYESPFDSGGSAPTPTPTPTPTPDAGSSYPVSGYTNTLTGTSGSDELKGGIGKDKIDGKGGSDVLTGGWEWDAFVFSTKLGSTNVDKIRDFYSPEDVFLLKGTVFSKIAHGELNADAFHVGTKAIDADDRIIYNKTTGALSYDADGVGGAAAIRFATLLNKTSISADDFYVY
jgi:Ca2+-binding RTX toxin-like protein